MHAVPLATAWNKQCYPRLLRAGGTLRFALFLSSEIRARRGLRRGASGDQGEGARAHGIARVAAREGISHGRALAGDNIDPHIAKVVKACQELPGQELLQYVDENGELQDVTSGDVNAYLKKITGRDITAKKTVP